MVVHLYGSLVIFPSFLVDSSLHEIMVSLGKTLGYKTSKVVMVLSKRCFLSLQILSKISLSHLSLVTSKIVVLGEYAEDVEVIRVEEVEVIRVESVEEVLCTWCSLWPWGRFFHQVEVEEK